ncbi:hypothetical protein [Streptomyces sp. NPDC051135]|uniref:hypothetical protein n=1 Tax=unclassified Streptomyces TaxID=2593676 RepID=UPI00342C320B
MTHFVDSKAGVDDPVTVMKSYTVLTEEAGCFARTYQENARILSARPVLARSRRHRPPHPRSPDAIRPRRRVDLGLPAMSSAAAACASRTQQSWQPALPGQSAARHANEEHTVATADSL